MMNRNSDELTARVLVLLGVILLVALLVTVARARTHRTPGEAMMVRPSSSIAGTPAVTVGAIDPRIRAAVDEMISKGVLRVDADLRRAWIAGDVWAGTDAQTKELVTRALAIYVSAANPMVTLYDVQSARELASYGPFQGFSVK